MKEISQNSDRYSKQGGDWVISASPDIKPLTLPIGIPLSDLKPVIAADGIVVKVGNTHLCSQATLNGIIESQNPHYDIIGNGELKVKDKKVVIGKTIKIIELDTTKLAGLIDSREFQNRQAGVTEVFYIDNPSGGMIEGIPANLVKQINYTLTQEGQRPSDKFEVVDYPTMTNPKTNPSAAHYTIKPIRTITDQQETIFDPLKLQTFLIELDNQLGLLRRDFNTIKETFFNGIIPTPNLSGLIQEDIIARTDVDDVDSNHSFKITESNLISLETPPVKQVQDDLASTATQIQDELQRSTQTLQQRSISLEEALRRAQAGDTATQSYIQGQLNSAKAALADIQRKLAK